MDYLLPSSVYSSPPRLGRGRQLNTIVEDNEEMSSASMSDSEGAFSDTTVIGRPAGLDSKYFVAQPQSKRRNAPPSSPHSVVSSVSGDGDEGERRFSSRSSFCGSDTGTVFSETCPSLTGSHASTTFASESSRANSIVSRSSRNRYPQILIPRGSWTSIEGELKQVNLGMSPSIKIRLSPEALESLPRTLPDADAPPSLGDNSSIRSESPYLQARNSLPVTPDMHNLEITPGRTWGGHDPSTDKSLEIAVDEHHSIVLSPLEAHSTCHSSLPPSSVDWNDLMGTFPRIPGATPHEMTPVTPNIPRGVSFSDMPEDNGVQLPAVAFEILQQLNRSPSPDENDEQSIVGEMRECQVPRSRPRSLEMQTPLSDYSFTQLSIPSPGGFFSSLRGGARRTWSSSYARASSPPPSSATAENFYNAPWNVKREPKVVETVLEMTDDNMTDGPPTVKQAMFDLGITATEETDDLYGSGSKKPEASPRKVSGSSTHNYEQAYEEGLKQAAEVNLDRTSHWLAAQTQYLSALRETNPLNNPADYPAPARVAEDDEYHRKGSVDSNAIAAERFLQEANKVSPGPKAVKDLTAKSTAKSPPLLEAFKFLRSQSKNSDTFVQASTRLESVQNTRIALPRLHVNTLLNDHTSNSVGGQHVRPKYRGPFSQNPRATGIFTRTEEQDAFMNLEREQDALFAIASTVWMMEAQQKLLYNGRLFACVAASDRLSQKIDDKTRKSPPRILDLSGAATASWGWAAAERYSHATVYTVQSIQQTELTVSSPTKQKASDTEKLTKPAGPSNHHTVSVPHLWQLPFKSNHFDVISARTLHMYLRSRPVPGVRSIDEWDMTLRECMRVLKPGGVLDYFVMDSAISNVSSSMTSETSKINISPSAMTNSIVSSTTRASDVSKLNDREKISMEFQSELSKRGYEQDGGCGRLMGRLKKEGFVGMKRQWIGLPIGQQARGTIPRSIHSRNVSVESNTAKASDCMSPASIRSNKREPAYSTYFNADGTSRGKTFRLAPRPISEVSSVSKIVDQYLNVEAVQGEVGSTNDVADMSALLGELMYEEWLVRLRIEAGKDYETALEGVHELFESWRRSGKAAWRGLVGWARKPTKSQLKKLQENTATVSAETSMRKTNQSTGMPLTLDTSGAYHAYAQQMQALGQYNARDRHVSTLSHVTQSAVERGDVGEITMMILN